MCQMNVKLEKEGNAELIMENVTQLEVKSSGIEVSTFFEEPKMIPDTVVHKIDFLAGTVLLQAKKPDADHGF
mgnify:CR=1 FL=1